MYDAFAMKRMFSHAENSMTRLQCPLLMSLFIILSRVVERLIRVQIYAFIVYVAQLDVVDFYVFAFLSEITSFAVNKPRKR